MKNWTQTLIIGFAGLSLAFAACGDDDNNTTTDTTPADTAPADTTPADTTPTAATDQCTNAADLAIIQGGTVNPSTMAALCGRDECISFAFTDKDAFESCVHDCMTHETNGAGLTDGCSLCYAKVVRCTADNCLSPPASCTTPSEACDECVAENCTPSYITCSGITPPSE